MKKEKIKKKNKSNTKFDLELCFELFKIEGAIYPALTETYMCNGQLCADNLSTATCEPSWKYIKNKNPEICYRYVDYDGNLIRKEMMKHVLVNKSIKSFTNKKWYWNKINKKYKNKVISFDYDNGHEDDMYCPRPFIEVDDTALERYFNKLDMFDKETIINSPEEDLLVLFEMYREDKYERSVFKAHLKVAKNRWKC